MTYLLEADKILILLLIMLGPVKMLVPFGQATQSLTRPELRRLSIRAAGLAAIIIVVCSFSGTSLLEKWNVSAAVLALAAGIIFFLTALQEVMHKSRSPAHLSSGTASPPTAIQVIFPMILTPYGIAAAIILLAESQGRERTLTVLGILLFIMLLDFLAMYFVRPILKLIPSQGLQITSTFLGVMMVALALQIILGSLQQLNLVNLTVQ